MPVTNFQEVKGCLTTSSEAPVINGPAGERVQLDLWVPRTRLRNADSSVRLITEQIQLVAKSDITGFVGRARKSLENGHFLEKRE
jgi:hypothetical protein